MFIGNPVTDSVWPRNFVVTLQVGLEGREVVTLLMMARSYP